MRGAFTRWCQLKGLAPLPAPPASVAAFIADCQSLGADRVWQAIQEVSHSHQQHGYADPTLGRPAALAMNALTQIEPPSSWARAERGRFLELPYDLQLYIHLREAQRDRALRRAQNDAANQKDTAHDRQADAAAAH